MKKLLLLTFTLLVTLGAVSQAAIEDRVKLRWLADKPVIREIVVDSNLFFSDDRIIEQLYSKEESFWRALRGDRRIRVQRESLNRDTLEVEYLYLTNGFLGVDVRINYEIMEPDSSARVHVTVHEGRQFVYGQSRLEGEVFKGAAIQFEKLTDKFKTGKPVNPIALRDMTFTFKTYLANHGYPYAVVDHEVDTTLESAFANIRVIVSLDSLVYFGDVTIEGLQYYPQYTASRELKIEPGSIYRRQDIIESQRRLFESGYFSTLQLTRSENSPERLRPNFTLRVRERKPRYVSTALGAVGQSNLRDLVWQTAVTGGKRNIFGSRRLEVSSRYYFSLWGDARILENLYRVRFTEPWTLGLRVPLSISFDWEPTLRVPDNVYKRRKWSVAAETNFRFSEEILDRVGIEYESLKLSDFPEDQPIGDVNRAVSGRRLLFNEFRYDSRDNLFIPSRGSRAELDIEYVGGFLGGDDSFFKIEASWATFQVVWPGWISATRIKGGMVEPFGDSDSLLTDDRLLIGGASDVRGFPQNRLGPIDDNGNPRGAQYTIVLNQEFRWRTVQIFAKIPLLASVLRDFPLWQSLFVDIGNGFLDKENIKPSEMAVSYGTGLQLLSPAGPIRLDYARRLPTDRYGFDDRWHFTILYAF